jgi:lysophospholipase L1-like esterase
LAVTDHPHCLLPPGVYAKNVLANVVGWLRAHPWLGDGMRTAFAAVTGVLAATVIARRRYPVAAFGVAAGAASGTRRRSRSCLARSAAAAALAAAAVTACSAPAHAKPVPAVYYLALGDSLSRGVQPDAAGTSVETGQGYPDLVYARLRHGHPGLRLVQLGCPGETTETMMHGGICRYPGGSQLAAAVSFLRAHRGHVLLITIDIGANDPEDCGSAPDLAKLASCIGHIPDTAIRLAAILASLRAAGPGVRIVGMNYYLPALAQWRDGTVGHAVARVSERLAVAFNGLLDYAYAQAGAGVADVFGAFDTTDFGHPVTVPGIGSLPRNVARICEWTWECAPPPRGPNQHANPAGYRVIADAFLKALGLLTRSS